MIGEKMSKVNPNKEIEILNWNIKSNFFDHFFIKQKFIQEK